MKEKGTKKNRQCHAVSEAVGEETRTAPKEFILINSDDWKVVSIAAHNKVCSPSGKAGQ